MVTHFGLLWVGGLYLIAAQQESAEADLRGSRDERQPWSQPRIKNYPWWSICTRLAHDHWMNGRTSIEDDKSTRNCLRLQLRGVQKAAIRLGFEISSTYREADVACLAFGLISCKSPRVRLRKWLTKNAQRKLERRNNPSYKWQCRGILLFPALAAGTWYQKYPRTSPTNIWIRFTEFRACLLS